MDSARHRETTESSERADLSHGRGVLHPEEQIRPFVPFPQFPGDARSQAPRGGWPPSRPLCCRDNFTRMSPPPPPAAPSLDPGALAEAAAALREANLAFARRYPGERDDGARQPVHTLIEGAQHWTAGVAAERGAEALRALDDHAPDAPTLGAALG